MNVKKWNTIFCVSRVPKNYLHEREKRDARFEPRKRIR